MMNNELSDYKLALYETSKLVLQLLSDEAQRILEYREDYRKLDCHKWRERVASQVIALAQTKPDWQGRERAECPLCKEGPQQGSPDGFTIPEGLNRHLEGSHNFYRCGVMVVAERLAMGGIGL
jgi:hypothetical protein